MAPEDKHFSGLVDSASAARQRYIATGLADALLSVKSIEAATLDELAEADAAEAASTAADKLLADYQAGSFASGREL